jgi:hypothetical protein
MPVVSDFEGGVGVDGWTSFGGGTLASATDGLRTVLQTTDTNANSDHTLVAPSKFLGDQDEYFDGTLSFDMRVLDGNGDREGTDVFFFGGVGNGAPRAMVYEITVLPSSDWTTYTIDLNETANWRSSTGALLSEAEIENTLRNITTFGIRTDWGAGSGDQTQIDNIRFDTGTRETSNATTITSGDFSGFGFVGPVADLGVVTTTQSAILGTDYFGYADYQEQDNDPLGHYTLPGRYLGDKTAFYGGSLTWQIGHSQSDPATQDDDVILIGDGRELSFNVNSGTLSGFRTRSVELSEAGWINVETGNAATESEMRDTLEDLDQIWIRGYQGGTGDFGGIKEVIMEVAPAPTITVRNDIGTVIDEGRSLRDALTAATEGSTITMASLSTDGGGWTPPGSVSPLNSFVGTVSADAITMVFDFPVLASWTLGTGVDSFTATGDIENDVNGNARDNVFYGGSRDQFFDANVGNDTFVIDTSGEGTHTFEGDGGTDTITFVNSTQGISMNMATGEGTSGNATIILDQVENVTGSIFGDYLVMDGADNRIRTLGDYDWVVGSDGADYYDGGNGRDMISYQNASAGVTVDLGIQRGTGGQADGDRYVSVERVTGSGHADLFYGGDGQEDFRGLGGYDWFNGSGGGKDRYDGGSGLDTVSYASSTAGVSASLIAEKGFAGDAARDLYTSIENLTGSNFDDILTGDNGRNVLRGFYGEDELRGNGGVDRITGGGSDDLIDGGSGWDYAFFSGNQSEYDIYEVGNATIVDRILAGGDGRDELYNIEVLVFADGDVFL